MIFRQWEQVLSGSKTQTRRLCKSNERLLLDYQGQPWVDVALDGMDRRKWYIGQTLAVQPGRGQKQVGRIRLTAIRQERVQDISEEDAIAEGCTSRMDFASLWDCVHSSDGKSDEWRGNPHVWVLGFEPVNH